MAVDNLTEDQIAMIQERGPVSELEFFEWELEDLSAAQRMSMEKRRIFLRHFALRGIILDGVSAARVSRSAVNAWRESEWFEMLYQAAMDEAADRIEAEAYRRSVDGYDEPVVYQGQMAYTVDENGERRLVTIKKYSDQLMALMLKGAKPDKYRDNHKVEHTGNAGGVLIVPGGISADEWSKQAAEQQAKYAGNSGDPE